MRKTFLLITTSVAFLSGLELASAHIGYGNRNFGTLVVGDPASVIGNQAVSSRFGWADGTDTDHGDSHRGRFFRFTLTTTADIAISVARNALGTGPNDTLLPAFSIYRGLGQNNPALSPVEQAGHDGATLSINSRPVGTEGSFRSLNDWSIGNDPTYMTPGDPLSGIRYAARLALFTYIGHKADGTSTNYGLAGGVDGDGVADGFVQATLIGLTPGDYSIFVGGADYAGQLIETGSPFPTYGVTVSVQAIPEPSTYALVLLVAGAIALRRRFFPFT